VTNTRGTLFAAVTELTEDDNCRGDGRRASCADGREPVIHRGEVVALLFNVSDIAVTLTKIQELLEEDDGEEEADDG
jgi:hypothetical protein